MSSSPLIPALAPGVPRKRNVLDVLESLQQPSKILIRVDFNVPMNNANGEITDDSRIRGALPTIQLVLEQGHTPILMSHMGRPKLVQAGADDDATKKQKHDLSLAPVATYLEKLLEQPVTFCPDCWNATIPDSAGIVLLENLRFYKQEETNDAAFAQHLASYADAYINDAFGTCHRAHASTTGVPQILTTNATGIGVLVASELAYLDFTPQEGGDKIAAIIGGSKVSTKLPVIEGLLSRCQVLVLGGGLAFTFLKAQGIAIGDSLCEEGMIDTARNLLERAQANGTKVVLPVDAVCTTTFPKEAHSFETKTFDVTVGSTTTGIPDGYMGLDVGPQTVAALQDALAGTTKICFNGPMGVFEIPPLDVGTRGLVDVLEKVTQQGCTTVVGGGDSVAAVTQFGKLEAMSYVSTGGGATLELLAGDKLPGVEAIADFKE